MAPSRRAALPPRADRSRRGRLRPAVPVALHGRIDTARLRRAARALLQRYPNLRAGFARRPGPAASSCRRRRRGVGGTRAGGPRGRRGPLAERDSPTSSTWPPPLLRFLLVRGCNVLAYRPHPAGRLVAPLLITELCTLYAADGDTAALPPAPSTGTTWPGWPAGPGCRGGCVAHRRGPAGTVPGRSGTFRDGSAAPPDDPGASRSARRQAAGRGPSPPGHPQHRVPSRVGDRPGHAHREHRRGLRSTCLRTHP